MQATLKENKEIDENEADETIKLEIDFDVDVQSKNEIIFQ